jgi:hypothetical protein
VDAPTEPALEGEVDQVNIGQPKRIIQVEPVSVPLPEFVPEPAPSEPVREPEPAETGS